MTFNGGLFGLNDVPGRTSTWFMNKVTERTKGLIKFNFVGTFALTKPGEEITALQSGIADVGTTSVVYFPTQFYINAGFCRTVPFDITDVPMATKVMYKLYYDDAETSKTLQAEYEKQGLKFLFVTVDDSYVIESKAQITKLDDLKGKKVAALGAEARFFAPVGAVVVGMPAGDRPTALQTGVIDAGAVPFEVSFPYRTYEFAQYMIQTGFGCVTGNPISWSMNKWNKLPKEIQDIIIQTGKEAFMQNAVETENWFATGLATRAKATGDKPYLDFSTADKAKWASIVGEPVADWLKDAQSKGISGADTVVTKFIQYEKDAGYVFPKEWKIK